MTADEARAVACKCVPRDMTVGMVAAAWAQRDDGKSITDELRCEWRAALDAAPACECEAQRLLWELVDSWSRHDEFGHKTYLGFSAALKAARAYLARSKP